METKNFINFNHLKEINSGYFNHLIMAIYYSTLVLASAILGYIHAFFPFLFPFLPYLLAKKATDGTEKYFINKE